MYRTLALALVVCIVLVACGGRGSVDHQKTASEWTLIPTEMTSTPIGDGWTELRLRLAVRNDTGTWSKIGLRTASVTTREGYSYSCNSGGGTDWLPPGFQMEGGWIICKVAEASTGHKLRVTYWFSLSATPEEWKEGITTLDWEALAPSDLSYPIAYEAVRIYSIGEPIQLDVGTLTIDALTLRDYNLRKPDWCLADLDVSWTFANGSQGYDTWIEVFPRTPSLSVLYNFLPSSGEHLCLDKWDETELRVGPGQTRSASATLSFCDNKPAVEDLPGSVLLITVDEDDNGEQDLSSLWVLDTSSLQYSKSP